MDVSPVLRRRGVRLGLALALFAIAGGASGTTPVADRYRCGDESFAVALVQDGADGPRALPAVLLGDRVRVDAVAVLAGGAEVVVCERAPDAPMTATDCTKPTRRCALRRGALVPSSS